MKTTMHQEYLVVVMEENYWGKGSESAQRSCSLDVRGKERWRLLNRTVSSRAQDACAEPPNKEMMWGNPTGLFGTLS